MNDLNRQTVERLMHYYYCISEHCDLSKDTTISSARLAQLLYLDDTQVRKDLAAIGVKGIQRVGFEIRNVLEAIRRTLGFTDIKRAVVIGAGRLGGAITSYDGFAKYGLHIVALFDIDPAKVGLTIGGHVVQPLAGLETIIADRVVRLGILTVPAEKAQESADRLIKAGVKAIWNFSPTSLTVPEGFIVRHEHLSSGLAQLSYQLKQINDQPSPEAFLI